MKVNLNRLLLVIAIILTQSCKAQKNDIKKLVNDSIIDDFIAYTIKNKIFSGSVIVVKKDTIVYKKTEGIENYDKGTDLNKNSKFLIASLSKPFTAMAIMQLKEKGLINYENTLSNYFKEFPEYSKTVTIKHLLNHTSGIPNHYDLGMQDTGMTNYDVLKELIKHDLLFKPGTKFSYSNSGYILLALIIEKITKKSYGNYIKEHIFNPLEMNNSAVRDENSPNITNMADGIAKYDGTQNYPFFTTGATGIYSTIDDLILFDRAMYTDKIIKQETLKEAFKIVKFEDGSTSNYGFGWHVSLNNEKVVEKVYHTGGAAGYTGFFFRDVKNKHTVIFISNNRESFNLGAFANALTGYLYGKEIQKPKIPITIKLNDTINRNRSINIESIFESLKQKKEIYKIDEEDINDFGYYLLKKNDLKLANAIFKINTEIFPNSWNTYDSYAESFLKLNDNENARRYYSKALKMNPEVENPEAVLEKIMNSKND